MIVYETRVRRRRKPRPPWGTTVVAGLLGSLNVGLTVWQWLRAATRERTGR